MDILTVNYEWPGVTENCGGGGRIGKQLVDGLRERGHSVEVVTDDADRHYATFPFRSYRNLRQTFEQTVPDLVHGHFTIPSSLMLPRLCQDHQIPLVVTPMGADVYDPTRFKALRPLTRRVNRSIFNRSDAVTPPSYDLAERMCPGQYDSEVIHYGIDPTDWEWRSKERNGPLRVLTVCRLVERKNLDLASDVIDRYRKQHGAVRWRVVGKGPLSDQVSDDDCCEWRGYVDNLQDEFDWADVFFLPSRHEAFGIVFLEALAAGLPVLTTNTGGQTDIVDHGTIGLHPPPKVEPLTAGLHSLATGYNWYQKNTREYVEDKFSRSHMVDRYERVFKRLHEQNATRVLRRRNGDRKRPVSHSKS